MISRRSLLAAGLGGLITPALAQPTGAPYSSLARLAAQSNLIFGTAAATYEFEDKDFPPLLAREAAMLVPEYEMKRDIVEPAPGRYDFSGVDKLMGFAQSHNMMFRGHTLVWYAANPPWLKERVLSSRDEKLLTNYVSAVASRYGRRLHSLDVVNEALAQPSEGDMGVGGLRDNFWLKAFGPSYIDMAFHAARAADPYALLVYNDYGCEAGDAHGDRMRANCLKLLDGMLARGVPVQAFGMQGHLSAFGAKVNQDKLWRFVNEIAARRLVLLVTEMDVDDEGSFDIAARDRAVADEAARFLDVVLASPNLQALLTWGLTDRYADPPDEERLKASGWRYRKFPYDSRLAAKPLRAALARAFSARKPA